MTEQRLLTKMLACDCRSPSPVHTRTDIQELTAMSMLHSLETTCAMRERRSSGGSSAVIAASEMKELRCTTASFDAVQLIAKTSYPASIAMRVEASMPSLLVSGANDSPCALATAAESSSLCACMASHKAHMARDHASLDTGDVARPITGSIAAKTFLECGESCSGLHRATASMAERIPVRWFSLEDLMANHCAPGRVSLRAAACAFCC